MTKEKTVIIALGAAASLFFAPLLIGSLKTGSPAQEDNTMMKGNSQGVAHESCHCAKVGKKCECESGDCKSSCGGEGLNARCAVGSLDEK